MTETNSDIAAINEKIKPILGQEIWLTQLSQEGYLILGCGRAIIPPSGAPFAQFQLQVGYCVWRLETPDDVLISSGQGWEEVVAKIPQMENHVIQSIEVLPPSLETIITFDQALKLKLFPIYSENEPVWRLYHKNEIILSVEPKHP